MEREIRSILFVYDSRQTIEYLCLSTFFSLCGFITFGIRWDEREEWEYKANASDLILFLGGNENNTALDNSLFIDANITSDVKKDIKSIITRTLQKMEANMYVSQKTLNILEKIKDIFIEEDLLTVEYNGQFYFYVQDEVEKAFQTYYKACVKIRKLMEEYKDNPYFWSVRGQFVRRMQCLAITSKSERIYNITNILGKLQNVYKQDETFYSLLSLMASLAETDDELQKKAGYYYEWCIEKSIEHGLEKTHLSMIYYRWAHWLEAKEKDKLYAYNIYKKAYESDRKNYRALYKIARFEEQIIKDYDEAWRYYEEIQDILEKYSADQYMQPIENEYLFKVYLCKRNMIQSGYYNFVDESEDKRKQDELLKLNMKLKSYTLMENQNIQFFNKFYGKDSEKYLYYMINRLGEYQRKI